MRSWTLLLLLRRRRPRRYKRKKFFRGSCLALSRFLSLSVWRNIYIRKCGIVIALMKKLWKIAVLEKGNVLLAAKGDCSVSLPILSSSCLVVVVVVVVGGGVMIVVWWAISKSNGERSNYIDPSPPPPGNATEKESPAKKGCWRKWDTHTDKQTSN